MLQQQTAQLTGTVKRIVFQSRESGFSVLHVKVLGSPDLVTVIGSVEPLCVGEGIEGHGWWQKRVVHNDMLFNCQRMKRLPLWPS